jgi:hypothetical protein
MKINTQKFAATLTMIVTLTIGSSMIYGQDKSDTDTKVPVTLEQADPLVGVWEEHDVPAEVDCTTRQPLPGVPIVRVLFAFNQGGTGHFEDNAPYDGPYRSTGATTWKRVSRRTYTYLNWHYTFAPDKTFVFTISQRANLTVSQDGNSFSEIGTFDVIIPSGVAIYSGCYEATANRLLL